MSFSPGEEVICIHAGLGWATHTSTGLVEGKLYIVEAIDCALFGDIKVFGNYWFFSPKRFRPLRWDPIESITKLGEPAK